MQLHLRNKLVQIETQVYIFKKLASFLLGSSRCSGLLFLVHVKLLQHLRQPLQIFFYLLGSRQKIVEISIFIYFFF